MKVFFAGLIVVFIVFTLWFVGLSISALIVSALVSYLFEADFGFWKAFSSVWLVIIVSNLLLSGLKRRSTQ